jgi:hypothetical protein
MLCEVARIMENINQLPVVKDGGNQLVDIGSSNLYRHLEPKAWLQGKYFPALFG